MSVFHDLPFFSSEISFSYASFFDRSCCAIVVMLRDCSTVWAWLEISFRSLILSFSLLMCSSLETLMSSRFIVETHDRSFLIRSFSFCASAAAILNRAASTSALIRFWAWSAVFCFGCVRNCVFVRNSWWDLSSFGGCWHCVWWVEAGESFPHFSNKIAPDADCSKSGNSLGLGP